MKAWRVERITDEGEMRLKDVARPEPGEGDAIVRVEVAGVNFLDTLMIRGRYQRKPELPFTPGVEIAGTVVAGAMPTGARAGARVCGSVETGAFAEFVRIPAASLRVVPEDVPADQALVLLGINYPTSYYALHERARLRAGETVLVHAAAGGVGSAAVQIAKAAGCRVIGTAGGAEKVASVLGLGADAALDYNDAGWVDQLRAMLGREGADVIYDPVGGDVALASLRALAWHGRYLVIGFAAGPIPNLPANRLLLREASAIGVFWGEARARDAGLGDRTAEAILALYRQGKLPPLIGARFGLAQAREAIDLLGRRATSGKVLIDVATGS